MQGFMTPANGKATPESIARKRRMAEQLMSQGMQSGPVGHWSQGAARMAQALVGGLASRRADEQDSAMQAETKREQMARQLLMDNRYNDELQYSRGRDAKSDAMPKLDDLGNGQFMQYDPRDPQGTNQAFTPEGYNPQMAGADAEYGLQPIITQDEAGKYHLFQANKAGGAPKEIELPYGWTPQQQYLDTGTGFQAMPKVGTGPGAAIPKDLAGAEAAKVFGKDAGEAAALHSSLSSKMPGLLKVVGELEVLADQATYTQGGQAYNYGRKELGMSPTDAAVARSKYIAMVDNQVLPMLRDTFGAQFTVVEGESLRATLGDPNKTPQEKKAVLNAFIQQKARNIEATAQQGGVVPPQAPPVPQAMPDVSTMSDEELEALSNGP